MSLSSCWFVCCDTGNWGHVSVVMLVCVLRHWLVIEVMLVCVMLHCLVTLTMCLYCWCTVLYCSVILTMSGRVDVVVTLHCLVKMTLVLSVVAVCCTVFLVMSHGVVLCDGTELCYVSTVQSLVICHSTVVSHLSWWATSCLMWKRDLKVSWSHTVWQRCDRLSGVRCYSDLWW